MKPLLLALICLSLTACAPKAWTKTGFSLEQGDTVYRVCESVADSSTPSISYFDVDVAVAIRNSYYDDFLLRSRLENDLRDEAQDILNDYRQDIINSKTRDCMIQDGWQEVEDPR